MQIYQVLDRNLKTSRLFGDLILTSDGKKI